MLVNAIEGVVENGQIRLREEVSLAEKHPSLRDRRGRGPGPIRPGSLPPALRIHSKLKTFANRS